MLILQSQLPAERVSRGQQPVLLMNTLPSRRHQQPIQAPHGQGPYVWWGRPGNEISCDKENVIEIFLKFKVGICYSDFPNISIFEGLFPGQKNTVPQTIVFRLFFFFSPS